MQNVAKVLNLNSLTVLDLPDSGLKEMIPQDIVAVINQEISRWGPDVIVTYAVHGISGFHDHLVAHAVVKHAFIEMKKNIANLKRLAMLTISEEQAAQSKHFHLNGSTPEEIAPACV